MDSPFSAVTKVTLTALLRDNGISSHGLLKADMIRKLEENNISLPKPKSVVQQADDILGVKGGKRTTKGPKPTSPSPKRRGAGSPSPGPKPRGVKPSSPSSPSPPGKPRGPGRKGAASPSPSPKLRRGVQPRTPISSTTVPAPPKTSPIQGGSTPAEEIESDEQSNDYEEESDSIVEHFEKQGYSMFTVFEYILEWIAFTFLVLLCAGNRYLTFVPFVLNLISICIYRVDFMGCLMNIRRVKEDGSVPTFTDVWIAYMSLYGGLIIVPCSLTMIFSGQLLSGNFTFFEKLALQVPLLPFLKEHSPVSIGFEAIFVYAVANTLYNLYDIFSMFVMNKTLVDRVMNTYLVKLDRPMH